MAWLVLLCFSAFITLPSTSDARPPKAKRGALGKIIIFSLNQGATVEINGKEYGTIPLKGPVVLKPGNYSIRVHKRGHTDFDEAITVTPRSTQEIEAELIPFAGVVKIHSNIDGATVAVDGKLLGTTPLDKDIPAGKREFTIQAPGHAPFQQLVDVVPGQPLEINAVLKAAKAPVMTSTTDSNVLTEWWFWTIIGAVVAGGVTATVLLVPGSEEVESGIFGKPIQF